jgi:hypothetical protein
MLGLRLASVAAARLVGLGVCRLKRDAHPSERHGDQYIADHD